MGGKGRIADRLRRALEALRSLNTLAFRGFLYNILYEKFFRYKILCYYWIAFFGEALPIQNLTGRMSHSASGSGTNSLLRSADTVSTRAEM